MEGKIEGKIEGKGRRGRRRKQLLDGLMEKGGNCIFIAFFGNNALEEIMVLR